MSSYFGQPIELRGRLEDDIVASEQEGCLHLSYYSLTSVPTLTLQVIVQVQHFSDSVDSVEKVLNVHRVFNEQQWIHSRLQIPPKTRQVTIKSQLAYLNVRTVHFQSGSCKPNDQVCTFEPHETCAFFAAPVLPMGYRTTSWDKEKNDAFIQLPHNDTTLGTSSGHYLTSNWAESENDLDAESQTILGPILKADISYRIQFRLYRPTATRDLLQLLANPVDIEPNQNHSPYLDSPILIWSSDAHQMEANNDNADNWLPITLKVRFDRFYQLRLRALASASRPDPFALDDFSVQQSTVDSERCSFASDFCGYHHDSKSNRLFIRSDGRLTDPNKVNNYSKPAPLVPGQAFIYLDYTNVEQNLSHVQTKLWSERLEPTDGHCLRYRYNLQGENYGQFNFSVLKDGDPSKPVFQLDSMEPSTEWKQVQISVTSQSPYFLVFNAELAVQHEQVPFLALADIEYLSGQCEQVQNDLDFTKSTLSCNFSEELCHWSTEHLWSNNSNKKSLEWNLPSEPPHFGTFVVS